MSCFLVRDSGQLDQAPSLARDGPSLLAQVQPSGYRGLYPHNRHRQHVLDHIIFAYNSTLGR